MSRTEAGFKDELFWVDSDAIRRLLPTVFQKCAYNPPLIEDATRTATATKSIQEQGYFKGSVQIQAILKWDAAGAKSTAVTCNVYDISHGQRAPRAQLALELGETLRVVADRWAGDTREGRQAEPDHDPIVAPGKPFECVYTGTLRDYSACATQDEVVDLTSGVLPLGSYTFGFGDRQGINGPDLFMGNFRTGAPMEYNGVLVCAPQNSGKTSLVVRWAKAATRSVVPPYAVFLIDVKGNMRYNLDGLAGDVYCFSTDPANTASDRMNFLDGPMGLNAVETDRIRQLVTALLPARGFLEQGGLDEYHYRNRVIWLTAFVHILKLAQCYYPGWFLDDNGNERNVDLADLYDLIADEESFYNWIAKLQDGEATLAKQDKELPVCGVDHWIFELAIMLDRNKIAAGQRPEKDSFRTYTTALLTALEPFSKHGTLHQRVRSYGPGRLFNLETVLGEGRRPVTVILSARQQDLDKSAAVLSLAIKRLQWFLFDRMAQPDAGKRPVLLLLDETRRIRDFDAAEYITFAREAKTCCVIVYQSLDQVIPESRRIELLENVGVQIYLGSLVGNTARNFMSILPKRSRTKISRQIVRSANTETLTLNITNETVDYLTSAELYHLPGGHWPALVYINDQPRRAPFFTDMSDPSLEQPKIDGHKGQASVQSTSTVPQLPPGDQEIVIGPPSGSGQ